MTMDIHALLKKELADQSRSEWTGFLGGSKVTLYAKPLSPGDNHAVLAKYPNFNQSMDMEGMAYYIVLKAEDDDGKRVFAEGRDMPLLRRLGQVKIGEIFRGLFGDQVEEMDPDGNGHEDRVGN